MDGGWMAVVKFVTLVPSKSIYLSRRVGHQTGGTVVFYSVLCDACTLYTSSVVIQSTSLQ